LLLVGALLFGVVEFAVIPHNNTEKQKYAIAQLEPTTANLSEILGYKNSYMGDSSNIINLFYHLPLADVKTEFQMFPDELTVEVDYKDTIQNIGGEKVEKALLYNSTAAFALIGNLKYIVYNFTGVSYKVSRTDVEKLYDDFGNILKELNWKSNVQSKLNDKQYVSQSAKQILIQQ
jgi:hypothetical protein